MEVKLQIKKIANEEWHKIWVYDQMNDKSVMIIGYRNYQEYRIYVVYDNCANMTKVSWFDDRW